MARLERLIADCGELADATAALAAQQAGFGARVAALFVPPKTVTSAHALTSRHFISSHAAPAPLECVNRVGFVPPTP
jgi:hypothetical protein